LLVGFLSYLFTCAAVVVLLVVLPDGRWVRVALAGVAFVASLTFMAAYHFGTSGDWRRSDIGVNLMIFGLTNAIVMGFVVAAFLGWIPVIILPFFSALTYLTVAWLEIWRTVIMTGYLGRDGDD
jgi:hypothetical protein